MNTYPEMIEITNLQVVIKTLKQRNVGKMLFKKMVKLQYIILVMIISANGYF